MFLLGVCVLGGFRFYLVKKEDFDIIVRMLCFADAIRAVRQLLDMPGMRKQGFVQHGYSLPQMRNGGTDAGARIFALACRSSVDACPGSDCHSALFR